MLFQPFGISQWHDPQKYYKLIGFVLIVILCTYFNRQLLPRFLPKFFVEEKWVIWKEILALLFLLLTIAIGILVYMSFLFDSSFSFQNFITSFIMVVLIGIFPTVFWVFADYILKLKKYSKPIEIIHHHEKLEKTELNLVAENGKDVYKIKCADLLYIESTDNYSSLYILDNGKSKKDLIRSTLSKIEIVLNDTNIVRCHRSYIVNLDHVAKVSGNAQGFKLHLSSGEIVVPVARKYSAIIERLK